MKMRTALALLVDDDLANKFSAYALRCRNYGFSLQVLRLPPHVSLKQTFVVKDFERFERYFAEFAGRLEPQHLKFEGFTFWGNTEHGIVAARVAASARLLEIHSQLNAKLEQRFGDTQADFDGDAYRFHLTVAIGSYRSDLLPQLRTDIAAWKMEEVTISTRLAMFIYEESVHPNPVYGTREYGTYKVLSLVEKNA